MLFMVFQQYASDASPESSFVIVLRFLHWSEKVFNFLKVHFDFDEGLNKA